MSGTTDSRIADALPQAAGHSFVAGVLIAVSGCSAMKSIGDGLGDLIAVDTTASREARPAPDERYVAVHTYEVKLHYFSLNHVDAYECTNETAPHVYYTFWVGNDDGIEVVASRTRDQYQTMRNGSNSPGLMTSSRQVRVLKDGGRLHIRAMIKDSDTGGAIVDGDDPIAEWHLRWTDAQIAAAKRDRNGTIHSGIGLRNNKCNVSFWYTINKVS